MLTRHLLLGLLCCLFCVSSVFAQGDQPVHSGSAAIVSIKTLNDKVNENITNNQLFSHRVTLNNANGVKIWGNLGKYREDVNCYFEMKNGRFTLKKVVVTATIADRQTYIDYLYDGDGTPTLCYYHHNVAKAGAPQERYYYLGKKLILLNKNEIVVEEQDFTTDMVQEGIEMLNKGVNYKKMFDAMIRIQLDPSNDN